MLCLNDHLRLYSLHISSKEESRKSFFMFPEGSKIQCQYYSILLEILSGLPRYLYNWGDKYMHLFKCANISVEASFEYDSTVVKPRVYLSFRVIHHNCKDRCVVIRTKMNNELFALLSNLELKFV